MRYLIASILLFTMTQAQSADWTPVFAHLEQDKQGDEGQLLEKVTSNISHISFDGTDEYAQPNGFTVADTAKAGNYSKVPAPYRQDMLPAKAQGDYAVILPLKNATLYGLPIKSLTYAVDGEEGFYGYNTYVNFGKLSSQQYNQLTKKVKLKTRCYKGKENGV